MKHGMGFSSVLERLLSLQHLDVF